MNIQIFIVLTMVTCSVSCSGESLSQPYGLNSSSSKIEFHPESGMAASETAEVDSFTLYISNRIKKYYALNESEYSNLTEEQKLQFGDDASDSLYAQNYQNLNRFDRMEKQPRVSKEVQNQLELEIQSLLDQCNNLIGFELKDKNIRSLTLPQGPYTSVNIRSSASVIDHDFYKAVQANYLTGRTYKCESYLYSDDYSLSDFGYVAKYPDKTQIKKQKIESLYELAYLKIKKAGLLRKIESAYYPKSLIREHADQTGLTKFIRKKEATTGKNFPDDQLAVEYFGSYKKWIKSLNQFINKKIQTIH